MTAKRARLGGLAAFTLVKIAEFEHAQAVGTDWPPVRRVPCHLLFCTRPFARIVSIPYATQTASSVSGGARRQVCFTHARM
eukprot:6200864-Pleurochrysis_carterae.AAC.2